MDSSSRAAQLAVNVWRNGKVFSLGLKTANELLSYNVTVERILQLANNIRQTQTFICLS